MHAQCTGLSLFVNNIETAHLIIVYQQSGMHILYYVQKSGFRVSFIMTVYIVATCNQILVYPICRMHRGKKNTGRKMIILRLTAAYLLHCNDTSLKLNPTLHTLLIIYYTVPGAAHTIYKTCWMSGKLSLQKNKISLTHLWIANYPIPNALSFGIKMLIQANNIMAATSTYFFNKSTTPCSCQFWFNFNLARYFL